MHRKIILLKYFIFIIPCVFCRNLPLQNMRNNHSDDGIYCCEVQEISHNLDLDNEITNRLNRVCWRWNAERNDFDYYLVAESAEHPSEGIAVDIPFSSSQVQAIFLNDNKFEFKVFGVTDETWHIVCVLSQTHLSEARVLFNNIYGTREQENIFLEPFKITQIRKHPNLETADNAFSMDTFVYRETGRENVTFIFTRSQFLWNPILIISNADFRFVNIDLLGNRVMLRVLTDDYPYTIYFGNQSATLKFIERLWACALKT